jgi:hypothetical protein
MVFVPIRKKMCVQRRQITGLIESFHNSTPTRFRQSPVDSVAVMVPFGLFWRTKQGVLDSNGRKNDCKYEKADSMRKEPFLSKNHRSAPLNCIFFREAARDWALTNIPV